jgi:hypothetical protein
MANPLHNAEKIIHRLELEHALAKFAAGDYLRPQLIVLAEKQLLPSPDFSAGANQGFPGERVTIWGTYLSG